MTRIWPTRSDGFCSRSATTQTLCRLLQDSAAKLPDSPEVQFHVGMAHYMMGDEAAARSCPAKGR